MLALLNARVRLGRAIDRGECGGNLWRCINIARSINIVNATVKKLGLEAPYKGIYDGRDQFISLDERKAFFGDQ